MRLGLLLLVLISLKETGSFSSTSFTVKTLRSPLVRQSNVIWRSPLLPLQMSKDENEGSKLSTERKKKRSKLVPFFGRLNRSKNKAKETLSTLTSDDTAAPESSGKMTTELKPDDPAELAKSLRAQAKRTRLEAERMDAELTLAKIGKLERQLSQSKVKGESVDDLQLQLDNLQAKLRGEQPKAKVVSAPKSPETTLGIESPTVKEAVAEPSEMSPANLVFGKDFDETKKMVEDSPGFIKKLIATLVECDFDVLDDINSTEVARRVSLMNCGDFSYSNLPKPVFSKSQIDNTMEKIEKVASAELSYPEQFVELAGNNATKLAFYTLEYDYYVNSRIGNDDEALGMILKVGEDEEWMKPLLDAINQTAVDRSIETLYPKCMRKEDLDEPTMAQIQMLFGTVLPQAKFTSTSKPEKVLGGYVIRGSHRYENADELIEALDKEIAKANLADKMTVFHTPDFTVFAQAEEDDFDLDLFDPEEQPPILYVTSSDIARDRQRFLLSLTSAFGLATSWYLSIYPFLLNPGIAKRVEDQLALADSSMAYDLDWLTELSVPLFVSFLGIQLAHELAHRLVAARYSMKISFPTLVPSLITGTTSTVTTFKEPPKNKEAMFDFAIAGPLVGILASVIAITIGSQLTISSDPATLPALPLDILRQSTLGGGIIDGIMKGSLYAPDGAPTSGILINLHPLAIAGYISLIVNALSLLPIGTTDGGRVGLTLFGRPAKLVVGNLFLFSLLFTGLLGSDLFLFYFSFVIAFQTGNEVPSRDETANISFPRIIVATFAYCLAFLSLVPFQ